MTLGDFIVSLLQNSTLLKQPEIVYVILLFVSGYFYLFSLRKNKKSSVLRNLTDTDILVISLTFSTLAFISSFFLIDAISILFGSYPLTLSKITASEILGIMLLVMLISMPSQKLNETHIKKVLDLQKVLYLHLILILVLSLFLVFFERYAKISSLILDICIVSFFLCLIFLIENWLTRT